MTVIKLFETLMISYRIHYNYLITCWEVILKLRIYPIFCSFIQLFFQIFELYCWKLFGWFLYLRLWMSYITLIFIISFGKKLEFESNKLEYIRTIIRIWWLISIFFWIASKNNSYGILFWNLWVLSKCYKLIVRASFNWGLNI